MLNYLILAHKSPSQLKRLIKRLDHPKVNFYVHIDKKVSQQPFAMLLSDMANVHFVNDEDRHIGIWGDFSLVAMAITAMRYVKKNQHEGHCVLLSGQDYPLRPASDIYSFFQENKKVDFINGRELPYQAWESGGRERTAFYKFNISSDKENNAIIVPPIHNKEFYTIATFKKILYLLKNQRYQDVLKLSSKRIFPKYLTQYGGDAWWAFSANTVAEILNFIDDHPQMLEYFKYTKLPDEIFFQSIIMSLKGKNIAPCVTYIKWLEKTASPVIFRKEDITELITASNTHLFVRKLDMDIDIDIFDLVDDKLLKNFSYVAG